jgi:hypothetical protein
MRTKLGLLDVGSTWFPFPEVARNILTDLLLERNRSRKLNFRFTEFSEVARQASGSGIMVVVERVKVNYATPWLEKKGEDDAQDAQSKAGGAASVRGAGARSNWS